MNFEIVTHPSYWLIDVKGDLLGLPSEKMLLDIAQDKITEGQLQGVLDISEVPHMNSIGLTITLKIHSLMHKSEGKLVLLGPTPSVNKLLGITKLNMIFNIATSLEEAENMLT